MLSSLLQCAAIVTMALAIGLVMIVVVRVIAVESVEAVVVAVVPEEYLGNLSAQQCHCHFDGSWNRHVPCSGLRHS